MINIRSFARRRIFSPMVSLLLLFVLLCDTVSAQNFKAADKYFNGKAYSLAQAAYEKELPKTADPQGKAYAQYRIAECLLGMNRPEQSISYFAAAVEQGYNQSPIHFSYGVALQMLGYYGEAKQQFAYHQQQVPDDKRTANKLASCDFALSDTQSNPLYTPAPLSVLNTTGSEYGVAYYQKGLIYSSTGPVGSVKDVSPRTGLPHSQIYFSRKDSANYATGSLINNIAKTNVNAGTFCFDPDTHRLYYSSCEEGDMDCYISEVEVKNGKYHVLGKLKVGNSLYSMGHPFILDNRIYFTSSIKGGYGGTDIWYIERKKDNTWANPVNAGGEVNTAGNESFPFALEDKLFFSSDGHIGYGGLDIFVSEMHDGKFGSAKNLGRPFNTSYDDFNLIIADNKESGMLVSNRNNVAQGDDIFTYVNFPSQITVSGLLTDGGGAKNVLIKVESDRGEERTVAVDENGSYQAYLLPNRSYTLSVVSDDANSTVKQVSTQNLCVERVPEVNLSNPRAQVLQISGIVGDKQSKVGISKGDIIIQLNGKPLTAVQTDATGHYSVELPAVAGTYSLLQESEGYLPEVRQLTVTADDIANHMPQTVDFASTKIADGAEVSISDVLYDFDKSTLTSIAKQTLSHLVRLLQEYPAMRISISSHTDARGSSVYNFKLSKARANSVEQYFLANGIDTSRFVSKAYGKSQLLFPNARTSEEHQKNRRTTFSIIAVGAGSINRKED